MNKMKKLNEKTKSNVGIFLDAQGLLTANAKDSINALNRYEIPNKNYNQSQKLKKQTYVTR